MSSPEGDTRALGSDMHSGRSGGLIDAGGPHPEDKGCGPGCYRLAVERRSVRVATHARRPSSDADQVERTGLTGWIELTGFTGWTGLPGAESRTFSPFAE